MLADFFQRTDGNPSVQVLLDIFQTANPEADTDALIERSQVRRSGLALARGPCCRRPLTAMGVGACLFRLQNLIHRLLVTVGKGDVRPAKAAKPEETKELWDRNAMDKGLMFVFTAFIAEQRVRRVLLLPDRGSATNGGLTIG